MKSFKDLISEVAEPKPEEEKKFKDQHKVDIAPHPVSTEFQHKGTVKPKAKRKADQEGDANYDAAYTAESVEELDEISKKTLGSYIKKATPSAMDHGVKGMDFKNDNQPKHFNKAMQRMTGIKRAADKLVAKEEVEELDEISKKTLGSYINKAASDVGEIQRDITSNGTKSPDYKNLSRMRKNRKAGISTAVKKLTKEEVELDESITKMSHSRLKFHMNTGVPHGSFTKDEMKKERDRRLNAGDGAAYKAAKASMSEEVEQLDELSPNTLHSYIKKAAGNMAGNAAVAAAQASSSMKKSSPDVKRKIKNRMQGITGASGRLADKANMAENWQEEIPMMMRQLEFIAYAAEEIMDYVEMAGDPEEWFQNKISGIHQSMLSMYAYAQGGRRAGYGFDESVEEELKGGQKKLDHNKNGKLDAHDFKLMRNKKMKEEVDLDEAAPKIKPDFLKTQREKDKAHADAMGRHVKSGRAKTMTSTQRSMASMRNEEVEMLDETFKQGVVKLKDGGSVVLKKEDADLLNQMFKDLSAGNRKKMQEVAMKDKAGFEEILGFAREAL